MNTPDVTTAYRDGDMLFTAPKGVRVVTDRAGRIMSVIGMSVSPVRGMLRTTKGSVEFSAAANEQLDFIDDRLVTVRKGGYVPPTT